GFKALDRPRVAPPRRAARTPRRFPARGLACRCHRDRSGHALGARPGRPQITVQEHAVRRSPLLRPRRAYYCRRTDGLRACRLERFRAKRAPVRVKKTRKEERLMRGRYEGAPPMGPEAFLPVAFVIGYFFGSIPFGLILTKLAGTQDLRSIGSGSIGATNVLRTGNKWLAAGTLLGDMLKGTVAVIISGSLWGPSAAMLAGLGAFLGHLYPVWLKFKGGKGVATYIGVLLGLFWPAVVVFGAILLSIAFNTPYSSLSALIASFATPLFLWFFGHLALASLFAVMTLLLFWAHRENIRRLQAGTESKIGQT